MGNRISFLLCLWVAVLAIASPVAALQTITNPSFENGLTGWTAYSYVSNAETYAALPVAGTCGFLGAIFNLLSPGQPPHGSSVCGIQSSGSNGNGGVCQSFDWAGGAEFITVSAYNYSENGLGEPYDNGQLVRMGLVSGYTQNRNSVTTWVSFPWSDGWRTDELPVPGPGSYTIFIEAYQPNSDAIMSTLWDNVRLGAPPSITDWPHVNPDPAHPNTGVIVTWTTDVPSNSRVDYGLTIAYGQQVESAALTTSHTVTLAGLANPSTYHYRARSEFGTYSVESQDNQFDTPGMPVAITSGPDIAPDPENPEAGVIVTWTTDVLSTSRVDYGPTNAYGQNVQSTVMTTSHSVTLADLEQASTYHCRAKSTSGTYSAQSFDTLFSTPGPPVSITSGPDIAPDPQYPETRAIVTWTTDVPSTSRVDYGPTNTYGQYAEDTELTTSHSITITGLARSSTYHCRAGSSVDEYTAQSADAVFTTPIQMTGLNVTLSADNLTAYVDWQTDVPTGAQVEYWPVLGGHLTVTEPGPPQTDHHVVLSLVLGKEYHFIATSQGASPYTSASASGKFFALPPPSSSLLNGGFEAATLYPWVQYTTDASRPPIDGQIGPYPGDGPGQWNPPGDVNFGLRAYDGSHFLGTAAHSGYKDGGVFQRVNVVPGQYYALSARFNTYRWGGGDGYNKVRIGVDPNGGIDPSSPDVRWSSAYSEPNNSLWHAISLTATGGAGGVATVFVQFYQPYFLEWNIAAVDGVSFLPPEAVSIGALKSSASNLGAVLTGKIVTYASPSSVWCRVTQSYYRKAYVEDDNRSSGVAVLFPLSGDFPVAGNKLTVTGALAEYDKEAAVMAESWTVDHGTYTLPKALALNQAMISTAALNQPPAFSHNIGLCTIGLRVRVFGRVTWVSSPGDPGDVTAYVDDGGRIADASGHTGVRVYLRGQGGDGVLVGDYVAATGVLAIELTNPQHGPGTADLYSYSVFTNLPEDWTVIPGG